MVVVPGDWRRRRLCSSVSAPVSGPRLLPSGLGGDSNSHKRLRKLHAAAVIQSPPPSPLRPLLRFRRLAHRLRRHREHRDAELRATVGNEADRFGRGLPSPARRAKPGRRSASNRTPGPARSTTSGASNGQSQCAGIGLRSTLMSGARWPRRRRPRRIAIGILHRRVRIHVGNRQGRKAADRRARSRRAAAAAGRPPPARKRNTCGWRPGTRFRSRGQSAAAIGNFSSTTSPLDQVRAIFTKPLSSGVACTRAAVDRDLRLPCTSRECGGRGGTPRPAPAPRHADRLAERIVGGGGHLHRHPRARQGRDRAGAVERRRQPVVAGGHPHVDDVVGNDAVDGADAAQAPWGSRGGGSECPPAPASCGCSQGSESAAEAVGRLVVAHGLEVAGDGRGAGVEEGPLHAVAPIAVALDAIHPRA